MKVIVTGGCGFIGTHLVRELVQLGHQVKVIDNQSSGCAMVEGVGVDYFFHNICDTIDWIFKDEDVDCVFHLAAEARIQESIENPKHTAKVNVLGTVNVLEACRVNNVPRFINSSSSSVYGLTDQFPTPEETKTDCLNPYAASKLAAEEMVHCYARVYGIKAFNLRYFNVFGEDSPVAGPYSLVIGLFLDQFKKNQPLTVVGDGSSLRDFVYVGDVVDANIRAMDREPAAVRSDIINIGSGQHVSVLDIATAISPNFTYVPPRAGEAKQTLADTTRAKQVLGWEPRTMVLDWIKTQLLPT